MLTSRHCSTTPLEVQLTEELKVLREENKLFREENQLLREKVDLLIKRLLGRSSEKLDDDQLMHLLQGDGGPKRTSLLRKLRRPGG